MQKLTLKIPEIHCSSCVIRLESLEDDLQGIQEARASYVRQTMEITYDERVLSVENIISAVKALGYTPAALNK